MSKQGKGARARSKARRKRARKARKDAMQAQYQAWAAAGMNRKTKRHTGKVNQFRATRHAVSYCGNLGCEKCHSFANPWKVGPTSCIFSKRFTSSKWKKN